MNASSTTQDHIPDEARAIAKEAYIYGEPTADGYRIQHPYFGNRDSRKLQAGTVVP